MQSLDKELVKDLDSFFPASIRREAVVFSIEELRIATARESERERPRGRTGKWEVLGAQLFFAVGPFGELVLRPSRGPLPERALQALHLELQGPVLEDLHLTVPQKEAFQKSTENYLQTVKSYFRRIQEDRETNDAKNHQQIRQEQQQQVAQLCRSALLEFEESLTPAQRKVADRLLKQVAVARLGLVGWLVSGDPERLAGEKSLKPDPSAQEKLLKKLDPVRRRIMRDFRNRELQFESRLVKMLSQSQRESVKEWFGAPLRETRAQPELHFYHLKIAEARIR